MGSAGLVMLLGEPVSFLLPPFLDCDCQPHGSKKAALPLDIVSAFQAGKGVKSNSQKSRVSQIPLFSG